MKDDPQLSARPFLISFSGIDGAGKTTQIELLTDSLQRRGFRVLQLSFWDDVAVWPQLRSSVGQHAANFYQDGQSTKIPEARNYKHIRKWYLTIARACLATLDALRLRRMMASRRLHATDVVIFDRYIYDQFANIYSPSFPSRTCIRMIQKITPRPDLAIFLDASPTDAHARKPEYPLDFVYENRRAFLGLRGLFPELTTIPASDVEDTGNAIQAHIRQSRLAVTDRANKACEKYDCSPATEFL